MAERFHNKPATVTSISRGCAMSERDIFLAAVDLPDAAARSAYLDEACGGDAALRARVEALLRSHEPPAVSSARRRSGRPKRITTRPGPLPRARTRARSTRIRTARPCRWMRERRLAGVPRPAAPPGLARPDRALRGARGPRPGRLRHRLPGLRRDAAARGRGQGAGAADGRHLARPQAVPARGPVARPRSGTRTSCRSTRSRSSRCRTW